MKNRKTIIIKEIMNIKKIGIVTLSLMLVGGVVLAANITSKTLAGNGTVDSAALEIQFVDNNTGSIGGAGNWNIGSVYPGEEVCAGVEVTNLSSKTADVTLTLNTVIGEDNETEEIPYGELSPGASSTGYGEVEYCKTAPDSGDFSLTVQAEGEIVE